MSIAEIIEPITETPPPRRKVHPNEALYEEKPSSAHFEIVNGKIIVEEPMGIYQEYVTSLLGDLLRNYCTKHDLGHVVVEAHIRFPGSNNDRRPDVMFVSYNTSPKERGVPTTNAWSIVPDLVIEVVSPSDRMFDVYDKIEEYFQGGVKSVWLVLSRLQLIHCYTSMSSVRIFTSSEELVDEPTLPGLKLNVASVFPKVDES